MTTLHSQVENITDEMFKCIASFHYPTNPNGYCYISQAVQFFTGNQLIMRSREPVTAKNIIAMAVPVYIIICLKSN